MSFGRVQVAQGTGHEEGQGRRHSQTARDARQPRRRRNGQPAAAYIWHVASGGVLVVVDLDRDGWRSVTNDAEGVVADLAELLPDLLARIPLVPYRDSTGRWDALCVDCGGAFSGFAPIDASSEADAVAWVLAQHG